MLKYGLKAVSYVATVCSYIVILCYIATCIASTCTLAEKKILAMLIRKLVLNLLSRVLKGIIGFGQFISSNDIRMF